MTYHIVEEATPPFQTEEQSKRRTEIYDLLIGELSYDETPRQVGEIERETGIKPPSWFKSGGVTLSQISMTVQNARR